MVLGYYGLGSVGQSLNCIIHEVTELFVIPV